MGPTFVATLVAFIVTGLLVLWKEPAGITLDNWPNRLVSFTVIMVGFYLYYTYVKIELEPKIQSKLSKATMTEWWVRIIALVVLFLLWFAFQYTGWEFFSVLLMVLFALCVLWDIIVWEHFSVHKTGYARHDIKDPNEIVSYLGLKKNTISQNIRLKLKNSDKDLYNWFINAYNNGSEKIGQNELNANLAKILNIAMDIPDLGKPNKIGSPSSQNVKEQADKTNVRKDNIKTLESNCPKGIYSSRDIIMMFRLDIVGLLLSLLLFVGLYHSFSKITFISGDLDECLVCELRDAKASDPNQKHLVYILNSMPEEIRQSILRFNTNESSYHEFEPNLIFGFNAILDSNDLYNEEAFSKIKISSKLERLSRSPKMATSFRRQFNRNFLELVLGGKIKRQVRGENVVVPIIVAVLFAIYVVTGVCLLKFEIQKYWKKPLRR